MAADSVTNRQDKKNERRDTPESAANPTHDNPTRWETNDLRDVADRSSDYVFERAGQLGDRVREAAYGHEGTLVIAALGVGFGLGVALGASLAAPRRSRTWRDRLTAEGLGQRMIERLEDVLPRGLADYLAK